MPRKNPLPPAEAAIGRRLSQARKEALIPRAALAVKLGISTDRLFSYETGRARLPWGIAERACRVLDTHPSWLAGAHYFGVYVQYDLSSISDEEREKTPFSDIYERVFAPIAADHATQAREQINACLDGLKSAIDKAIKLKVPITAADSAKMREISTHLKQLAKRMSRKPQS